MKEFLNCVMDIGEQMLISGAEVHRVEDSMNRMCASFGVDRVDCFIITSSMVVTVSKNDGTVYTQTRRINGSGTNFHKLDKLNALSRKICECHLPVDEIKKEIDLIKKGKVYPFVAECFAYAMIAAAFTVFFSGSLTETILSAFVGLAARFAVLFSDRIINNTIFTKFLSSFTITIFSFAFAFFGLVSSPDNIIIGNIMLIIPGLGFTNALRDLFTGDSIAGTLRSLEAVLSAVAIAAGYFTVVFLTGGFAI